MARDLWADTEILREALLRPASADRVKKVSEDYEPRALMDKPNEIRRGGRHGPNPCCRRFRDHPRPHGGIAPRALGLVQEYYEALGSIITSYEATLTCFMGDGLMLLLNAPVPCPDPALRGVQMAMEMQVAVQRLMSGWRERGHAIGFGMGLAKGPAIVGRIGYEGRSDYTAIGNVVNLASRICGAAEDGQILMDAAVAAEIGDALPLVPLGSRMLRGLTETVSLFSVRPTAPNLTKLPPGKVLAVQRNAWQS
jgi:hypothetical protein